MIFRTGQLQGVWSLVAHSLSGRLLLLTMLYVLASMALIFLPAMGIEERDILGDHILSAEMSILPFTTPNQDWPDDLRQNLLKHADADEVLLRRQYQRDYFQIGAPHSWIDRTIDLRRERLWRDIVNALDCLINGGHRTLHVIAPSRIKDASTISIILSEAPIRAGLMRYARQVMAAAAFISGLTGALVFLSLYYFAVRPMRRITRAMSDFHENPEDASRIIVPSPRPDEIGIAERELAAMQADLYSFLRQKEKLAAVGAAVSRIQHDLRNILANAQLACDRVAASGDPEVQRLTPRLMTAIDRAIGLATTTLKYGRTHDLPPAPADFPLRALIEEAAAAAMEGHAGDCRFENAIDESAMVHADRDQLFRIVLNLLRNACEACGGKGAVRVQAACADGALAIDIADSGCGIPPIIGVKLFQPFVSAGRPGGTGLGLAIARDLARGHGGDLTLVSTGPQGTVFRITLPA
ncbi:ATP-binding protein [Rhizomicrobium electricum]|uniref:ATP-binding protein n=1 Tax=Rhizomicrobium electricum TaxID=480070 RepID=UPI001422ED82|nr:HAMP domain-containing sensor histidine kinase [Rhizomicrobium electricum]NIJ49468.1 signal transduction histidine kinase [Rhizomicrobium electricum]